MMQFAHLAARNDIAYTQLRKASIPRRRYRLRLARHVYTSLRPIRAISSRGSSRVRVGVVECQLNESDFETCQSLLHFIDTEWRQLPLSLKAKLNQTVLTWEFPVLNVHFWSKPLVLAFRLKLTSPTGANIFILKISRFIC